MRKNLFATTPGIIIVGAVIGLIAVWLQKLGNPANMGICVACFERDVAGGLGLHRAAIVQYLRRNPGVVLGSLAAAIATREFKPRGGSAPIVRFVLGMIAAMGALVFLGCPWRAILRLAGGDGNAILGLAGLATGIWFGTLFFKKGYSLGRSNSQSVVSGALFPVIAVCLLLLYLIFPQIPDQPQSGPLFYSVKGPGSQHAPFIASLGLAFIIGIFAQRSRFCTMGAFRDLFLFRYTHLFLGLRPCSPPHSLRTPLTGGLKFGFEGQPVAHSDFLWNYLGMVTAGLAFALAGGCPGPPAVHGGGRRQRRRHFCPRHVGRRGYSPQSGHGQFRYGHRRIRYAGDDHRFRRLPDHRLRPFQEGVKEYCHAYH